MHARLTQNRRYTEQVFRRPTAVLRLSDGEVKPLPPTQRSHEPLEIGGTISSRASMQFGRRGGVDASVSNAVAYTFLAIFGLSAVILLLLRGYLSAIVWQVGALCEYTSVRVCARVFECTGVR